MRPGQKTPQTPLKLLAEEYQHIITEIRNNEGLSGILASSLKHNKGWTSRRKFYDETVYIDFWNDSAKVMFLLSYSQHIAKSLKLFGENGG